MMTTDCLGVCVTCTLTSLAYSHTRAHNSRFVYFQCAGRVLIEKSSTIHVQFTIISPPIKFAPNDCYSWKRIFAQRYSVQTIKKWKSILCEKYKSWIFSNCRRKNYKSCIHSVAVLNHAYSSELTEFIDIDRRCRHQNPGRLPWLSCSQTIERDPIVQSEPNHKCVVASSHQQYSTAKCTQNAQRLLTEVEQIHGRGEMCYENSGGRSWIFGAQKAKVGCRCGHQNSSWIPWFPCSQAIEGSEGLIVCLLPQAIIITIQMMNNEVK